MAVVSSRWLLCAPEFYDVTYEINPWMSVQHGPNKALARKQWESLHAAFKNTGAEIFYVPQGKGWPDMVFTANAGLVVGNDVVLSKFRFEERKGEEDLFEEWFKAHGFNVHKLTTGAFEGEGDALFVGDVLIGGFGFRSDKECYEEIRLKLNINRVSTVELVNPYFYHLDTCFCPIGNGEAIFFPDAFSAEGRKTLESEVSLVAIPEDEAKQFACNSVLIDRYVLMPAGCPTTRRVFESRGFTVSEIELTEFIKAGGAAKCLCLKI